MNETIEMTEQEVFEKLRKSYGFRGKQRLTEVSYFNCYSELVCFESNVRNGYDPECTDTFHYSEVSHFIKDLGLSGYTKVEYKNRKFIFTK